MSFLGRKPADAIATTADIADGVVTAAKLAGDFDDNIQTNIALLAFKTAVNGSLAKYDLQDQIIDEYTTNAGVNTGDSTYEELTGGIYRGENPSVSTTPTITHDADATGTDGDYKWYKWTDTAATGSYESSIAQNIDYIVVAGGGGGGHGESPGLGDGAGGGGAGGFRTAASLAITAQSYTITVGAGGTGASGMTAPGVSGGPSSIVPVSGTSIISAGGGGGGSDNDADFTDNDGVAGGSGGGAASQASTGTHAGGAGNTPSTSPAQGFAGGTTPGTGVTYGNKPGAGGGGASAVGDDGGNWQTHAGVGGAGENNVIGMNDSDSDAFLTTVSAGHDSGGTRYFSGGGGGGAGVNTSYNGGNGGVGGGGHGGDSTHSGGDDATDGTGGGGGGGDGYSSDHTGGDGGNGIVIIRALTSHTAAGVGDLILQSSDTTAESAPTKADMVILVQDAGSGIGTVNTHIKGWVSRYETGDTKTWTQGTLVDEGHWGVGPSVAGKRILAFHDLDISAQASGTQMAYKITTHAADATYDTRIHATSIGWR